MQRLLILLLFVSSLAGAATVSKLQIAAAAPANTCTDTDTVWLILPSGISNVSAASYVHCENGAYTPVIVSYTTTAVVTTPITPPSTLVISLTGDAYKGQPLFSLSVDGVVLERSKAVANARCGAYNVPTLCTGQQFSYTSAWTATGPHNVIITFLNDAWGGSATTDCNLYVNGITFNGVNYPAAIAALDNTGDSLSINVGTASPPAATPPPIIVVPPPTTTGGVVGVAKVGIPTVPGTAAHAASGNAVLLGSLLSAGGFVVLDGGTYNVGSSLNMAANTKVYCNAGVTIHANSGTAVTMNNNDEIYNCIFAGGGIWINNGATVVIASNHFQHINSGSDAIHEDQYLGANSKIDSNYFTDISKAGYPNGNPQWEGPGSGFFSNGFGDNVSITNNTIDGVEYDGLKGFFNQPVRAKNFLLAGNIAHHVHRIAYEFQDCSSNINNCWSGIGGSSDNAVMKDNYADSWWMGDKGTFAFSWPIDHASNMKLINNTAVAQDPCCYSGGGWLGYGMEISGNGTLIQGNSILSTTKSANGQAPGWGCPLCFDNSDKSTAQMNYLCGANSKIVQGGLQANGVKFPETNIYTNNSIAKGCPVTDDKLTSSNIALSTARSGASVSATVISLLSINRVDFFADASTTPFTSQELADVNSNFSNDRKWNYHATAPSDAKSIKVVATDVLGGIQTSTLAVTQ